MSPLEDIEFIKKRDSVEIKIESSIETRMLPFLRYEKPSEAELERRRRLAKERADEEERLRKWKHRQQQLEKKEKQREQQMMQDIFIWESDYGKPRVRARTVDDRKSTDNSNHHDTSVNENNRKFC